MRVTEGDQRYLRMTLQRPPRLFVDIDDYAIWVAREVNTDVNLYLCHFFVNFGLKEHKEYWWRPTGSQEKSPFSRALSF